MLNLPGFPDQQGVQLQPEQVALLRRSLLNDLFKDLESARLRWLRSLLELLAWPSATRFARIAATFDLYVEKLGFREGMRRILPHFVSGVLTQGVENIPQEGPLLVISNHPGTYDSLAIAAALPRDDLSILAFNYPLLQGLRSAREHLILVSQDVSGRMTALRTAIRHLERGGAVLIFPGGRVEPDPACLPGAGQAMESWSPSLELFLRRVPETKLLVTIVSGVLSPAFLNSRLVQWWKKWRDPQAAAEAIQVIMQMLFPQRIHLTPRIWFDIPMTVEELQIGDKFPQTIQAVTLFRSIVERARYILDVSLTMGDRVEGENT